MKKIIFKGSAVALVTPMLKDGSINFEEFEKLLHFQIQNNTDAIVVGGTTGEASTLSDRERNDLIDFAVKTVNKKIPVIAGTGSNSTAHAIENSKEAQNIGADALLIVTPYYNKCSQNGLIEHYFSIAENTDLPIILYNIPSRTGVNIFPETYLELSKHERIVATKEANGNISSVAKTRALCGENLNIYSGDDSQSIPIMSLGGLGVISVFANIAPRISHNITSKFLNGNLDESLSIFLEYLDLMNVLFIDINPIPIKKALNEFGFNCEKCRLPLSEMDEEKITFLKKMLKLKGFIK